MQYSASLDQDLLIELDRTTSDLSVHKVWQMRSIHQL